VSPAGGAERAGSQPQDQTPAQAAQESSAAQPAAAAQQPAAAQVVPQAPAPAQRAPDASAAWKTTQKVSTAVHPAASANQFAQQAPLIMIPSPSQSSQAAPAHESEQTFGGLNSYLRMWQAISQLSATPFYFGQPRMTVPAPAPASPPLGSQNGPDPRLRGH